jgi:two-component system cell cycle response regulator DivK
MVVMEAQDWQILVVEDEFDSIQIVSQILQHHGAQVFIARNGHECLALLNTVDPTLIMMDLALPEMDGWQTLEKVRALPDKAHIPVVAITAYHSINVQEDARLAGFDAYFPKPLDTHSIVKKLADIIKG